MNPQLPEEKTAAEHKLALALKHYRGKNKTLLEVDAKISFNQYGIKERIFVSLYEDFQRKDESKRVVMQLDCFAFRIFIEGLRTLAGTKKGDGFEINTGKIGENKKLTLGYIDGSAEGDSAFFVNLSHKEVSLSTPFDKFSIKALVKSFDTLIDDIENQMNTLVLQGSIKKIKSAAKASSKGVQ